MAQGDPKMPALVQTLGASAGKATEKAKLFRDGSEFAKIGRLNGGGTVTQTLYQVFSVSACDHHIAHLAVDPRWRGASSRCSFPNTWKRKVANRDERTVSTMRRPRRE